jgi:hypothetical protein
MSHLKYTLVQGLVLTFPWTKGSNAAAGNSVWKKILNIVHNSMGSLHHESPNVGATNGFAKTSSRIRNSNMGSHSVTLYVFLQYKW